MYHYLDVKIIANQDVYSNILQIKTLPPSAAAPRKQREGTDWVCGWRRRAQCAKRGCGCCTNLLFFNGRERKEIMAARRLNEMEKGMSERRRAGGSLEMAFKCATLSWGVRVRRPRVSI